MSQTPTMLAQEVAQRMGSATRTVERENKFGEGSDYGLPAREDDRSLAPNGFRGFFPVILGPDPSFTVVGDATTQCSLAYYVYATLDDKIDGRIMKKNGFGEGDEEAIHMAPVADQRPAVGRMSGGGYGLAYWSDEGELVLWWVNEKLELGLKECD